MEVGILHVLKAQKKYIKNFFRLLTIRLLRSQNYARSAQRQINKKVLYDHRKDKSQENKWLSNESLKKVNLETLPTFIINKSKYTMVRLNLLSSIRK